MIKGIGCDLVDHRVTDELNWAKNAALLKRVFSIDEIEIYTKNRNNKFLSGRFAAKEAILKCLGTGMVDGIALNQIEILQLTGGQPVVRLHGEVKTISDKRCIHKWHVSISHTDHCSMAYAIAESKENTFI